jgi:hypothetical protein
LPLNLDSAFNALIATKLLSGGHREQRSRMHSL